MRQAEVVSTKTYVQQWASNILMAMMMLTYILPQNNYKVLRDINLLLLLLPLKT